MKYDELDELWREVRDIVQETGIKIISMEKKCKKVKWLSEEALNSCEKKRSAKQRRKGKIYPFECGVPKNGKERQDNDSKFSKPGFNNIWTMNFQMFKLVLEKGRGTRDQIANIR